MEFGFFLGNIQQIGEHTELGIDRYDPKRTEQRRNILSGIFRLQCLTGIIVLRLLRFLRLTAMSQIKLATACVHDLVPRRGIGWDYF
jgi:hypothetical protein